jgi:hypothetical protein
MASLRGVVLAMVGGTLGTVSLAWLVAGCSDDSSVPPTDAALDQTDVGQPHEAGGDAADAGSDGDATIDTGADSEAGDASDAATGEASLRAYFYALDHAKAFCQGQFHCCDGYDSGAINLSGCIAQSYIGGFENTLPVIPAVYDSGHVTINETAAAACVASLPNVPCGMITAASNAMMVNACVGVFQGMLPIDAGGCVSSYECIHGYCQLPTDGGKGTCQALVGDGGPCLTSEMCTAATERPAAYCNLIDFPDANGATCKPLLPDGVNCTDMTKSIPYDLACVSELCAGGINLTSCGGGGANTNVGDSSTCVPPAPVAMPADAGGG